MRTDGLDVLVLGRECHVRALTGERRLWLAGTRPFTPAAVVVRSTASVFVPPDDLESRGTSPSCCALFPGCRSTAHVSASTA